ncbi:type II toxin-antitoxin system HicB family antitoxin [Ligilactobacillus sp. LYQ60]|uniref:type II toxin-antitoxin system HicB family antitoxin n=1 Tax=unclassified Ligilactobacillus TaxID=2767920 RepID=UPI003852B61D
MDIVTYPVIVEEVHDDGHYYVATSPNIKDTVTQGKTILELAQNVQDAIAGWISAQHPYSPVQDHSNWQLTTHQQIIWIMVNMDAWREKSCWPGIKALLGTVELKSN